MGYMSASDPRIHFGLGKRTKIDSLEITWPSGQVDRLTNVPIDQIIAVKEGTGIVFPRKFPKMIESSPIEMRSIPGYEFSATPFSGLFPNRPRQHAAGRAHHSTLEMEAQPCSSSAAAVALRRLQCNLSM